MSFPMPLFFNPFTKSGLWLKPGIPFQIADIGTQIHYLLIIMLIFPKALPLPVPGQTPPGIPLREIRCTLILISFVLYPHTLFLRNRIYNHLF